MKKQISAILFMAITLTFAFAPVDLSAQQTGPMYPRSSTNQITGVTPAASPTVDDEFIFGFSGPTSSNFLTLNGIDIPYADQGWYMLDGNHYADNDNYFCGVAYGSIYRNYFAFSLLNLESYGIILPITTASLKIEQFGSQPSVGFKLFELCQVNLPLSTINQYYAPGSPTGQEIWADLGNGKLFGSYNVDRSLSEWNVISITLNAAAISAINTAAGSEIIFGGKCDNFQPETVPVSNWALGIGIALILAVAAIRLRKIV
jgi:hypothetical protein